MDITPGSVISVEITATPRSAAAKKTLIRICRKDPQIARQHRLQKDKRPSRRDWIRGGRYWHHQMKSKPPVRLDPGAKYGVLATVDVLRDLESVRRWVRVSAR